MRHRAQRQARFALPQFNGRLNSTVGQKVFVKSLPSPFLPPPPPHSSISHRGERRRKLNKDAIFFPPTPDWLFFSQREPVRGGDILPLLQNGLILL